MAEEKVRWHFQESSFFQREREREIQEERGKQESGAFKRVQEGEEKCVLGIYPLLLDTPQWLS